MTYTLYIDESGDVGIEEQHIRRGACPLFFLGGYLVHQDDQENLLSLLAECRRQLNNVPLIHFCKLKHAQKVFCCRELSQFPITVFGLISDKSELGRGNFLNLISADGEKFYNKNVKYFLETICKFSQENDIEISRIVFEKREGKDYEQMKNYIRVIQRRPLNPRAEYLRHIVGGTIEARTKEEEPLLQVADGIAHSFFKLCIPDRYGVCETRYVDELRNLMPSDSVDQILDVGTKIVPTLHSLRVNDAVKEYIRSMTSIPPARF